MEPKKIDDALQRAVDKLEPELNVTLHASDLVDAISESNKDSKGFAIRLVQETLHELFDDHK
ncbi:hypothetical protein [Schleiferilactobacillus harbinensis]|uniref:hypothetical protein n=1 Tax=Schleiferilactobacillus harbinensis TaxID=304207 RepID=UPI0039E7EB14